MQRRARMALQMEILSIFHTVLVRDALLLQTQSYQNRRLQVGDSLPVRQAKIARHHLSAIRTNNNKRQSEQTHQPQSAAAK